MVMIKDTTYNTYGSYIRVLCKRKGTSLRQMCFALDIPYRTFLTSYTCKRMRYQRMHKVMDFLGGDVGTLMSLPLDKELTEMKVEVK